MSRAANRNVVCSVKWCDEKGTHTVHRKYFGTLPAGLNGAGMVGVNLAQRIRPHEPVCVELTVTMPWASTTAHLFGAAGVPAIAATLAKAAERAAKLNAAQARRER